MRHTAGTGILVLFDAKRLNNLNHGSVGLLGFAALPYPDHASRALELLGIHGRGERFSFFPVLSRRLF
jgi:hypothetical protein